MTKIFFMHHLCLGFTCIALIFCIHLAVLQSYLSLFSHIRCIHFAKLGTQLDLKIDWLIFESFVHFSICYFLCELEKIFFLRDMMDNQCANIFSTYATVYGSHSIKFAFIKRENIFLHVYPQLSFFFFFKVWCVCFYLSPPPIFSPKLFFPTLVLCFIFLLGAKLVFNPCC